MKRGNKILILKDRLYGAMVKKGDIGTLIEIAGDIIIYTTKNKNTRNEWMADTSGLGKDFIVVSNTTAKALFDRSK